MRGILHPGDHFLEFVAPWNSCPTGFHFVDASLVFGCCCHSGGTLEETLTFVRQRGEESLIYLVGFLSVWSCAGRSWPLANDKWPGNDERSPELPDVGPV
jgi:hypothetical protein